MRTLGTVSVPLPRILTNAFGPYTGFVFVLAMLFGGGARQGLWSDVVVELAALPLLAWALFKLERVSQSGRWAIVLLCAIVLLPLYQLLPLPPALWSSLPGRREIISGYEAVGMPLPWLAVSLDPAATWRGLLSLIPAISIFLAMLSLDRPARRNMVALLFVVVFASVPLDLLQMMGGAESPLRFYAITNPGLAVGFFANANHHAAFMYCAIPLAAGRTVGVLHHHAGRRLSVFLLLLFVGAVVVAISLTNSRAGMALTFVGGLSCLVLIGRGMKGRLRRRVLFGAIAMTFCALLVAFQFGFVSLAQKVQDVNVMGDLRWPVAEVTTQAALANMPLGTGFGTFVPIYEMSAPRTYLRDHYVNHAHNDWLELWLEAGVAALVLLSTFFAWFAAASYSVWRQAPANVHVADVALARAASIVIVLLALHSAVDYPLRTIALNSLFAVACAFLIQPTRQAASAPHTQAKMS